MATRMIVVRELCAIGLQQPARSTCRQCMGCNGCNGWNRLLGERLHASDALLAVCPRHRATHPCDRAAGASLARAGRVLPDPLAREMRQHHVRLTAREMDPKALVHRETLRPLLDDDRRPIHEEHARHTLLLQSARARFATRSWVEGSRRGRGGIEEGVRGCARAAS